MVVECPPKMLCGGYVKRELNIRSQLGKFIQCNDRGSGTMVPARCRISIRERVDPDNQYRCLYDFDEQNGVIEILLFVSTKQDLEKMLYRYLVVK